MCRPLGVLSVLTFLAVPLSALALAGSPAALLPQLTFKGNPHAVEAEFHMHHADTHVSMWMKGAAEGETLATMKAWKNITIDIAGNGMFVRAKAAVRVFNGALYAKLLSIDGDLDGGIGAMRAWTTKPWVTIEIPASAAEQKSFVTGVVVGVRDAGYDVSEEDVRALFDALADALFTMESTRYQGGAAYSLRLAPDYLHRAMQAVQSSVIGRKLDLDTEEIRLLGNQPVNLHIRVNTNTSGELVFVKWYAATDAEGVSVITQGKAQWQASPVYVEVPKDTMTLQAFSDAMGMEHLGIDRWKIPSIESDSQDMPLETEEEAEGKLPRATVRPYSPPSRVRRMEAPRMRRGCTATPGTAYYLQLARKGVCDLPLRSTYRVNDTTP